MQHAVIVDVFWDEYHHDSLKAETRGKRVRRRVEPSRTVPGNWQEFLRIDENKVELFSFVATSVMSVESSKQIISTHHTDVLCLQAKDVSRPFPCAHEETDTTGP